MNIAKIEPNDKYNFLDYNPIWLKQHQIELNITRNVKDCNVMQLMTGEHDMVIECFIKHKVSQDYFLLVK